MKSTRTAIAVIIAAALTAIAAPAPAQTQTGAFANGADVSWVNQEETGGYAFYNANKVKTDPFVLLKNLNVNAIRLRVWVNPANGWCDGADVLYKAKRAAAQGQRIMIDFHYSDVWADPGHQTLPAAWASDTLAQLNTHVYSHTSGILSYLKSNGIDVTWVQVGNEINNGMLWPLGSTSNFGQLAQLINSGYQATKSIYPNAKVILHLANGYNNANFQWFFDGVKASGANWDVIGMSHYPTTANWQTLDNELAANMSNMVARYNKPVIISEVGMDYAQATTAHSMMADVIAKNKALGSYGLGIFYWEPEAYPGWQGYNMGALNANGQFTAAMGAYAP